MKMNGCTIIMCRLLLLSTLVASYNSKAQIDSLQGFDAKGAYKHASYAGNHQLQMRLLEAAKRQYIKQKYFSKAEAQSSMSEDQAQRPASNCDNIGFENGTTSAWSVKGDYTVVSSGTDPFGKFPKVYPGGKYSLQLNNNNVQDKTNFTASATRLMNVASGNSIFNLRFAFVILNFPHDDRSAARFKIKLRDSTSHTDICADYNIYYESEKGPVGTSNFSTSTVSGVNTMDEKYPVTYAPWQTVSVDLSAYSGKTIAITVTCDWCIYEVDWAYCYIDGDCNAVLPQVLPCVNYPGKIVGPPGLNYYKWLTPLGTTIVSNTNTLSVTNSGVYELHCNQTGNCNEAPFYYKYQISQASMPIVSTSTLPCSMAVSYAIYNPLPTDTYTWSWQDGSPTSDKFSVKHVYSTPGICSATLQVKNADGCKATQVFKHRLSAPVTVNAVAIDPPSMSYAPDQVKTFEALSTYTFGSLSYQWEGPNYSVSDKYARVNKEGVYIVEATDLYTGCKDTAMVVAEFLSEIPNVFTPNNDGVNDLFRFRYLRNATLSITNRWGQLIFEAADTDGILSWDGTTKGNQTADGIYFYTLTPKDPSIKGNSGTVTLLR